jgi:Ca2+-binding EF-hand superfamily protein
MIRIVLGGAALIAIAAGAPSFAQDAPPPPPGPEMHRFMHGRMAMAGLPAMPPLTRADAEKRLTEHFAMLDLNHDGVLTRDEIAKARREHGPEAMMKAHRDREFAALDTDKNGSLSREEFEAPRAMRHMAALDGPPRPPKGHPMLRQIVMRHMGGPDGAMMGGAWFDRADANKDDKVTLAEAKASVLAMFDRADLNHDGIITPDERRAAFRQMRHGPGRMPGGPGMMPPPPPAKG